MSSLANMPDGERSRPQSVAQADLNSSDPYAVLGLARGADLREVKKAYFALVREYPPETEPAAFKRVRAAYEVLRTAESKAVTDLFLFREPSPYVPRKRRKKLLLAFEVGDVGGYLEEQYLGKTDVEADFRPVRI